MLARIKAILSDDWRGYGTNESGRRIRLPGETAKRPRTVVGERKSRFERLLGKGASKRFIR